MREAVANNNIRNRWLGQVATGRSLGRGGRGAVLGDLFCEILELPSELHELPVGPRMIFTSTCLQTGRAFRFARAPMTRVVQLFEALSGNNRGLSPSQ